MENGNLNQNTQISKSFYSDGIPDELKRMDNFVLWRLEQINGKFSKIPLTFSEDQKLIRCDINNPELHGTFKAVNFIYNNKNYDCNGVGFVLTGQGIVAIDIDHCIDDNGQYSELAEELLNKYNDTYAEFSQSGKGIHIFFKDNQIDGINGRRGGALEIYTNKRYIAITGNLLPNVPKTLKEYNGATKDIIAQYIDNTKNESSTPIKNTEIDVNKQIETPTKKSQKIPSLNFDDEQLLNIIKSSNDANSPDATFYKLFFKGDTSEYDNDDSRADNALMLKLAFWTNGNPEQMERLFYHSALGKRDKWIERSDYRERTINNAISNWNGEGYLPKTSESTPPKCSQSIYSDLWNIPFTDTGNAERLIRIYKNDIRYLKDEDRWAIYDKENSHWEISSNSKNIALYPFMTNIAKNMSIIAEEDYKKIQPSLACINENEPEGKVQKQILMIEAEKCKNNIKQARSLQSKHKIEDAIQMAKGDSSIQISTDDLNKEIMALNCPNCIIDLTTGKSYPHDKDTLFTQVSGVEYKPGYHSEIFDNFIKQIMPDEATRHELLKFLGYCLTGSVEAEKAAFILGEGGNGKGSLTKLLMALLNDFSTSLSVDAILLGSYLRDGNAATPEFAKLKFARVAIADEIPPNRKLDIGKFNLLTGGDSFSIRNLYSNSSTISKPTHKLILSGNNPPEIDDVRQNSLLRRLLYFPFKQDFTGDRCNPKLKSILLTPEVLAGALTVLVDYCIIWQKEGFTPSLEMQKARKDYLDDNDIVGNFIREFCEKCQDKYISRKDFMSKFNSHTANRNVNRTEKSIISEIRKMDGITYQRTNTGFVFKGIGWRGMNISI